MSEYVLALVMLLLTAAGVARFWHIRNRPIRSKRSQPTYGPQPIILLTKHGDTWR